jgi:hypothetical protein
MKQILHIFKKDIRLLWPAILMVLLLVAALFSISAYLMTFDPQSISRASNAGGKLAILLSFLFGFIPLGWFVLVFSVVLAERLAGETQFWITRPYEWKKLLASKLLFIVSFVYLPFPTACLVFLAGSGNLSHSTTTNVLILLGWVSLVTTGLVLPTAAAASVSASADRMMLNIFYGGASMIAATSIPRWLRPESNPGPVSVRICFALALLICGAVVLLQYARRRTRLSVALLVAIPVLICAISIFTPERSPRNHTQAPQATGAAAPAR